MLNRLATVAVVLLTMGAVGQGPSVQVAVLPDGTLSGNVYTNEALGLSYEFPAAWGASTSQSPVYLDAKKPDGLAVRCTKVLLRLSASGRVEGKFNSLATLLAIDPGCISGPPFPQTLQDVSKMKKVADQIVKVYRNSPFFSPYGVKITAFSLQGRVVLDLAGGMTINAVVGRHPATKELLSINTSFDIAEWNGHWIAWCYAADDSSTEQLKSAKVMFKGAPAQ